MIKPSMDCADRLLTKRGRWARSALKRGAFMPKFPSIATSGTGAQLQATDRPFSSVRRTATPEIDIGGEIFAATILARDMPIFARPRSAGAIKGARAG
jgi:hypothetical protein